MLPLHDAIEVLTELMELGPFLKLRFYGI